jgi:serine/threonine protein kinase
MHLTPEKWERVKELFEIACERDDSEREAILYLASSDGVREEVERLLREQGRMGSFLSTPAFVNKRAPEPLETTIGRYRLFEKIGEGGMGEVWLAEQTDPVRRRVALKVIKTGLDSREIIARFQSERQALALMDHPAIAKVLDAGSTDQGAPYFVMEYVAGVPITAYCDRHRLDLRERLELFKLVCEGVQHAHQKAIIHRDLKPSNILVTHVDGKPSPKIIDFGVAKALSQKLTEETLYTRVGAVIGTLEYMSPEQALSSGEDIDTRTDVYSLGVIFYELLSGGPPLRTQKFAFDEFLRRLREDDTPRPSTRIRTLDPKTGIALATARSTEPKALVDQIRGELDWIALKSLEKSRNRRYASATDFSRDIERYLNDEPVSAVPPSPAYRLRKFARRHRAALVTAASFVAVLAVATAISVRQSLRARREAAVSKAISDFLRDDLLGQADPNNQARGQLDPNLTVRAALDRAAQGIVGKFSKQPEVEAALRETMGQTFTDLGQYKSASAQFRRAAEIYKRVAGDEHPTTLKTMTELGFADVFSDPVEAEKILTRTLEIQRRVLGPEKPDTISTLSALAWAKGRQGNHVEGGALLKQVLELRRRVLGPEHADTLDSMHDLAGSYEFQGRHAESEALYRQLLQIQLRLFGTDHPGTLVTMDDLSNPIWAQGRKAEAESVLREALEIERRVLGYENGTTLDTMSTLGLYYSQDGQFALAEPLEKQVLEIETRLNGPNDPDTLGELGNWATTILLDSNRSRSQVNEALGLVRNASEANPKNDYLLATRGLAEYRSGHWEQAVKATTSAITSNEQSSPALYFLLAMAQWRNGNRPEALRSFPKGVEGMKEFPVLRPIQRAFWTEAANLLGKTPPPKDSTR